MSIDEEKIAEHIKGILIALGEDPSREGLRETPQRVAKMYTEVFEGIGYTNAEIAALFDKTFEEEKIDTNGDLVVVKDIPIHSFCEHHMALMYHMKVSVVYRPQGKVIGLSKIARIAEMVGKRLQLQERIGTDIASIMSQITGSEDIGVMVEGEHSCMTIRGIKKPGAITRTTTFKGIFKEDVLLRQEALLLMQS